MSNEQNIELSVTLAYALGYHDDLNTLIVNNGSHHLAFDKLEDPTRVHNITWTLTGNAALGEFCALDDAANPGFMWLVRTPGGNTFRNLLRSEGNKEVSISNRHCNGESKGHWYYQLFARFPNNRVYGVPLTFAAGTSSSPNPSIKNR